ncbi:MAG: hypothetical protein LH473_12470, partial [Chitinophagales bacterium]|nr:hypothetical protein [Chitinophagales bacterium]
LGLMGDEPSWFYFLMLAGFNVSYLLNNLEFWGTAAMMFDVRQSKRLFSIISSGDIPAKLIGYLASVFLGYYLGQENILWIAFGSLVISIYFFNQLSKTGALNSKMHHGHHSAINPGTDSIISIFKNEKLIRQAAFVSFFSYAAFILLNFIFFGYIKNSAVHHDTTLALFIAVFLATSRGITLLFKIAVTNRLVNLLGIRNSLLITPLLLFILILFALPASMQNSSTAVLYLFATITITIDVLRSAIQSPVLLATMEPLPIRQRLAGHTIIKGVMDPFAFFTIGVTIFIAFRFNHAVDYQLAAIILFILIVCWIYWILNVDKNYSETLSNAIKSKSIQGRELEVSDLETLKILRTKLKSCNADEAVFILRILKDQVPDYEDFISTALENPDQSVQKAALRTIEELKIAVATPQLMSILEDNNKSELLPFAIKALASFSGDEKIEFFLTHESKDVRDVAIISLLKESKHNSSAEKMLQSLISSTDKYDRIIAGKILSEMNNESYTSDVLILMDDVDAGVKHQAMLAAGGIRNEMLLNKLVEKISEKKNESLVLKALEETGEASVPHLRNMLISKKCSVELKIKILLLAGRIGGVNAINLLDACIDLLPESIDTIVHSLSLSSAKPDKSKIHRYQTLINYEMNVAAQLIFKIHFLSINNYDKSMLYNACKLELSGIRKRILLLFSIVYDNEKSKRAQRGMEINTRESMANAFEILDLVLPKEFSQTFICIFEERSLVHKCNELKRTIKEPELTVVNIRNEILRDKQNDYNHWTKACAIYDLKDHREEIDFAVIENMSKSENELVSETANYIITNYARNTN